MAELQNEKSTEGFVSSDDVESMVLAESTPRDTKRAPSIRSSPEPPRKCPRSWPSAEGGEVDSANGGQDEGLSPRTRRKSWRRSARGRRSLPPLPSTNQALCTAISLSLPEEERLEKLMEASMQLAVQKLQESAQETPGVNLEVILTQVKTVQEEWKFLAQEIRTDAQSSLSTTRDPEMQKAMERIRLSIQGLQAECESWESLLEKHRCKAEELSRRVEEGRAGGIAIDPARVSRSSQSQFILDKPDYCQVLHRQQSVLQTMELLMDTHCKMVRELLSFQEQCEVLVQETSGKLALAAGFQTLPSSPARRLLKGVKPCPTMGL